MIDELIDMLSIGTLIAYIMASVSIIRLRYKPLHAGLANGNSASKFLCYCIKIYTRVIISPSSESHGLRISLAVDLIHLSLSFLALKLHKSITL